MPSIYRRWAIAFLICAFAAATILYLQAWPAYENLYKGETAECFLAHYEAHEAEVSSSSGKNGEVTNIASEYSARPPGTITAQHIEGTRVADGEELEIPAEDTSRPIVKSSAHESMVQGSAGQELTNLEVLLNATQHNNKSGAQLLKSDHQGRDLRITEKWTVYSVYQVVETSMTRPGEIYISADLELEENRWNALQRFQLRIMQTPLRGKYGPVLELIVMHEYIALQIEPSTWVKAEKTRGRSIGQTGIHVKLETGPIPGDAFYEVNVSGVNVTLGQILDVLIALEPVYNPLQDNCWLYAYAGSKAILELCSANAVDDQSRKQLEGQVTELVERKPFMPKHLADLLHPDASRGSEAKELFRIKLVQKFPILRGKLGLRTAVAINMTANFSG